MKGILVHSKMLDRLISVLLENRHEVESVIVIQAEATAKAATALSATPIRVYSLDDILARGRANQVPPPRVSPSDVYYICYSSGTTGTPKGVIVSHGAFTSNIFSNRGAFSATEVFVHYCFLPFAHLFERMMTGGVCAAGGRQMLATGGTVANIVSDLAYLQATVIASVPRIFIRYYDSFQAALAKRSKFGRAVFWAAYHAKRYCQARHLPTWALDFAFREFKAAFGSNVTSIVTAGAALDARIHDFLQVVIGVPVRNGFGCSESGTGNIFTPDDVAFQQPGSAGGPILNALCRIEPVEGYDPGCGQVLLGGYGLSLGYLHDEDATRAIFVD
jgi:long-chain acyl-CoA synthetase